MSIDALGLELLCQSAVPVLEEGLAAAVGSEIWSRGDTGERSHGEDKTLLALSEEGCDNLGNLESSQAVDVDDVLELFGGGLEERNGDAVGLADVVDEDADVQS